MNNKVKKPDLILSMDDKVYLAVAYKQADGMGFIYALVCRKLDNARYNLFPEMEILTFKNTADAKVYYQTISQIQEFQDGIDSLKKLKEANKNNKIPNVIGKFFFFILCIPEIIIYKETKPDIQCVIPDTTLSKHKTGYVP